MTITTVAVSDSTNPTEVQAWMDAHPTAMISVMWSNGSTFFIVYS